MNMASVSISLSIPMLTNPSRPGTIIVSYLLRYLLRGRNERLHGRKSHEGAFTLPIATISPLSGFADHEHGVGGIDRLVEY